MEHNKSLASSSLETPWWIMAITMSSILWPELIICLMGDRISFGGQVKNYQNTVSQMVNLLGDEDTAANYLSKCIYSIGLGSNDYLNNYFMPQIYSTSRQYNPEQYAENLYNYGARKFVLIGVGQIGCSPSELAQNSPDGRTCDARINSANQIFNNKLRSLVDEFNGNTPDAKFIYINAYGIFQDLIDRPAEFGLQILVVVVWGETMSLHQMLTRLIYADWRNYDDLQKEKMNVWRYYVLLGQYYSKKGKPNVVQEKPQVPCFFIFGDSLSDNGNNNNLKTLAKANYLPYGIDHPLGPTGRFSNGRNTVDLLAQHLGFKHAIQSFASSRKDKSILKGVNYASGSSGIRDETGKHLGENYSFKVQMQHHKTIISQIRGILGRKENVQSHLNKCLYFVGIGNNDYLNNYFIPEHYSTSRDFSLEQYAVLYDNGARKIALVGLGQMGCIPRSIDKYKKDNGTACAEEVNTGSKLFNKHLKEMVEQFNGVLKGAKLTYINSWGMGEGDPAQAGFKVSYPGCCQIRDKDGQCLPSGTSCNNRKEYLFWDAFHPTEALSKILAARTYKAFQSSDCYPVDISRLSRPAELTMLCEGKPQVPCFFIFGDSLSDNGNNNNLNTLAKANYLPYGIDHPHGPTGRFSNGRNTVDLLAHHLGFEHPIQSFASSSKHKSILKGVNYASGSSGIRDETGKHLGERFSFKKQMQHHKTILSHIREILGSKEDALSHLKKCLYYVLYKKGARKIAVVGLGQIGCIPRSIDKYKTDNGTSCAEEVNKGSKLFNKHLKEMVEQFNGVLEGANLTYINSWGMGEGNPAEAGFKVTYPGCCQINDKDGQCLPFGTSCNNRKEYLFWDAFHPTEALNKQKSNADPQVPCYFIFGDSLADNGNNNYLNTLAKVDYSPYGVDFPVGPTGRFCNGRTIFDVIGELLGFDAFIPPFASANATEILSGVNYASGAAGILYESGKILVDNHQILISRWEQILGSREAAAMQLNKCLYAIGIGNNDYLNNYFLPEYYNTSKEYNPVQFADLLIQSYTQQLLTLYEKGARKFALFGLGRIGCAPGAIALSGSSTTSGCAEDINEAAQIFNERLISVVQQLNGNLMDAQFIYINNYKIGGDATVLGFSVNNTGCCASDALGQCVADEIPCQNRTQYMFWDLFHPTELFNIFYAERSYKALDKADAYPFDIRQLKVNGTYTLQTHWWIVAITTIFKHRLKSITHHMVLTFLMAQQGGEMLGFDAYIPPYRTVTASQVLQGGVNVELNRQLKNHQVIISRIVDLLGIGSNDYINNYFQPNNYPSSSKYDPQQYAEFLMKQYYQQIKILYNYGARMVAMTGIGPIGCTPNATATHSTGLSLCVDSMNDAAKFTYLSPFGIDILSEYPGPTLVLGWIPPFRNSKPDKRKAILPNSEEQYLEMCLVFSSLVTQWLIVAIITSLILRPKLTTNPMGLTSLMVQLGGELLGFQTFIKPFTTAEGVEILRGVNYGSAYAGILDKTGQHMGARFTMKKQLKRHKKTISSIIKLLGNEKEVAEKLLEQCLYLSSFGANDYINNYYLPNLYNTSSRYTPEKYAKFLELYRNGARKVAFTGTAAIGCTPNATMTYGTNGSLCVEYMNEASAIFNRKLAELIQELNKSLPGAKFSGSGRCCCPVNEYGLCKPLLAPCQSRDVALFWDALHPAEFLNHIAGAISYIKIRDI
ncbi:hypothetical protein Tsubulata_004877, partial [Turnera subulata]